MSSLYGSVTVRDASVGAGIALTAETGGVEYEATMR